MRRSSRFMPRRLSLLALGAVLGAALLAPVSLSAAAVTPPRREESIIFSGGCFWGVQAVFQRVKGVTSAISGYAGGQKGTADYERVSDGNTGHAESVKVTWNPDVVSLETLLDVFFRIAHDPTQLNRQGPDVGTQYRSAIFYMNDTQRPIIARAVAALEAAKVYRRPVVTQVQASGGFYPAEAYHQNYFDLHPNEPYIVYNDRPKVEALKARYPQLYQETKVTAKMR